MERGNSERHPGDSGEPDFWLEGAFLARLFRPRHRRPENPSPALAEAVLVADDFEHFLDYLQSGQLPPGVAFDVERSGVDGVRALRAAREWFEENAAQLERISAALRALRAGRTNPLPEDLGGLMATCHRFEQHYREVVLAA